MKQIYVLIFQLIFLIPLTAQNFNAIGTDILWQVRPSVIDENGNIITSVSIMDAKVDEETLIILVSSYPIRYYLQSYHLADGSLNWSKQVATDEEQTLYQSIHIIEEKIVISGNGLFVYPSLIAFGMFRNKVYDMDGTFLSSFAPTFDEFPGLAVEGLILSQYDNFDNFNFVRANTPADGSYNWKILNYNLGVVDTLLNFGLADWDVPTRLGLYKFSNERSALITHNINDLASADVVTNALYFSEGGNDKDTVSLNNALGDTQFLLSTFINNKIFIFGNIVFQDPLPYTGRLGVIDENGSILFSDIISKEEEELDIIGIMGDQNEQYYLATRKTNDQLYTTSMSISPWKIGETELTERYSIINNLPYTVYFTGDNLFATEDKNVHIITVEEYENESSNFFGEAPIRRGVEIVVTRNQPNAIHTPIKQENTFIAPNPVEQQLKIGHNKQTIEYQIIDVNGKLRLSGMAAKEEVIDVQSLNPGIYFINMNTNTSTIQHKFIKL